MIDEDFEAAWLTLQPTRGQRRRVDARVAAWLEAGETSLAAEWFGLFKVAPFSTAGLAAASAVSLATTPPLIWLARALI